MPDVTTFNQLISNLLHDGNLVAAQHVIDVEMPAAGIVPDDKTKQAMARAPKLASQGRVQVLKRLLREGKDGPTKTHEARDHFQTMLKKGGNDVDIYMCSYAMAYLCPQTHQQRELLTQLQELLRAQKITLCVSDVTQLVNQLMYFVKLEDKDDEDNLKRTNLLAETDKQNVEELTRLITETDKRQARMYFDQVVLKREATSFFYGHALAILCENSDEQREMLNSIPEKRVTMYAYNALVNQLQSEGKEDTAMKVLEVEMPAAGFEVNEASLEAMKEFTWKSWSEIK
jgi:hypothetical protein